MYSVPPGYSEGSPQNITVLASLGRILSLTNDGTINLVATLILLWNDSRLGWNVSQRQNLTQIYLEAKNIWTPQLSMINPANANLEYKTDMRDLVLVRSNGDVQLMLPRVYSAACHLDLTRFPFDTQQCDLVFSEKHYTEAFLRFTSVQNGVRYGICKDAYVESAEWHLQDSFMKIGMKTLLVANQRLSFSTFQVTLVLKRYPSYFVHNLVLPATIMFLLLSLLLILPSERSERIMLSSSLVVSIYVLQQTESSIIPVNSGESIPYCAQGMLAILVLSVTALMLCVINIIARHFEVRFSPAFRRLVSSAVRLLPPCKRIADVIVMMDKCEKPASESEQSRSTANSSLQQHLELPTERDDAHHADAALVPLRSKSHKQEFCEFLDSEDREKLANKATWTVLDYSANLVFFLGYICSAVYLAALYMLP